MAKGREKPDGEIMFSDVLFGENLEELFNLVESLRESSKTPNADVIDGFCCDLENAIDRLADDLYEYGEDHDKRIDNARDYIISRIQREVEEVVKNGLDNF